MFPRSWGTMLSCVILTYNEERRIGLALRHAMKWADEVVVVDKESTDQTREIAAAAGARVETIPFSKQGHESVFDIIPKARNDWVLWVTPGDVPTSPLMVKVRGELDIYASESDGFVLPVLFFSFGHHDATRKSPWSLGYQPRLVNQRKAVLRKVVHDHIHFRHSRKIPFEDNCFILHQTHATATSFLKSHGDYAEAECSDNPPATKLAHALNMLQSFSLSSLSNGDDDGLKLQAMAWTAYWSQVALRSAEKLVAKDVLGQYEARARQFLEQHWG